MKQKLPKKHLKIILIIGLLNAILCIIGSGISIFSLSLPWNIIGFVFFFSMIILYNQKVINKVIENKQTKESSLLLQNMKNDMKDGFREMKEMLTDKLFWQIFKKNLLGRD